jgi:hypothetical protein
MGSQLGGERVMKKVMWFGLCLLVGCGGDDRNPAMVVDPILNAPPVPREMLERVLAEPEVVPRREAAASPLDTAVGTLGEGLGAAIEDAAGAPQQVVPTTESVTIIFFTADWCAWCRPAKEKAVPWLTSLGYTVEICDVTRRGDARRSIPTPRSLPAWVFLRHGREVHRQEGGYLPEHLQAAVKKVAPTKAPQVGAWLGPTFQVADALPLVAGMSLKLGSAATVSVPADLKWTTSQKPGSIVLSFDPAPQVTVHKILNWRVRLEGLEITPTAVTLQIDRLPDISVKLDWNCPVRSSGVEIDTAADLHRAATGPWHTRDRPVVRFVGRSVLFAYRVCTIASFVLLLL